MDKAEGAVIERESRIRKFKTSWLEEDIFKGWLAPDPPKKKAKCTICDINITRCKTHIVQHSQTAKHVKNINKIQINKSNIIDNRDTLLHVHKVKHAEIKLAAFFAEHNVAFYVADHLIPLLKDICVDPEIVADLSLARDKCKNIVTEVIAKREIEEIVKNLQTCKFSILIDESTDISETKILCVLVRYVCPNSNKIATQLLQLLAIDATDSSASKIFGTFKNLLEEKNSFKKYCWNGE